MGENGLDFGIFTVMQQRNGNKSSFQIMQEAVEQTVLADKLGFAAAWYPEHHFSNYSLCPSPLMMAAHCAGKTEKIKLGSAVLILPLYTPSRLLAEIAMVDNLSNGRLQVGIGAGYQQFEFERFGVDIQHNKQMANEVLDMIEAGLTEFQFKYEGDFYKQMPTSISMRTRHNKVPPIWIATFDPNYMRRAIQRDHGIFVSGWLGSWKRLGGYREEIDRISVAEGKAAGSARVGLMRFAFVSDKKADVEQYVECARYQQRLGYALKNRRQVAKEGYMVTEQPYDDELPFEKMMANIPVGDAETVAERLVKDLRALRPQHLSIAAQVGDIEQHKVLKSLELFAERVIPLVKKELGDEFPFNSAGFEATALAS